MKNHVLRKRITLNFLLVFIGIFFFLSNSNHCSAQSIKAADAYKAYIQQADQAFAALDYEGALILYEKANKAEPEYNYASGKIDEIKKILEASPDSKAPLSVKSKNSNDSYKTFIAQADYAFATKDYAGALLLYKKAYVTKPDYNYAPEKIDEINSILNASPDLKSQLFENTILKAERLYEQKNFQQAKSEYQKALLIDSAAQLPEDRLEQISSGYIDPDDMANYNIAIASGDKELADSDFDHAILFYEAALELHPNAKFINKKITDAKKQQADYKVQTEKSAINIASADKLLQSEKPDEARAEYQKALTLTPDNKYAKEKIKEIDSTTTKKALPGNYDKSIEQADLYYKNSDFANARLKYQEALKIMPEATYPKEMLDLASKGETQLQSDQKKYDTALAGAENSLKSADFETALIGFKSASAIKPSENYPKTKITEIEQLINENASRNQTYDLAIKKGDQLLSASKYNEALNAYKQALSIKPNEAYPTGKTDEINSLLAKQKSDSDNYAQAIRTGEKALAAENYSLALISFQNAQKIKPSEQYPLQQINEIKAETANQQKKEEKYTNALKTGDQLFADKEFNGAITAYSEASELKKNEKYPQDQIAKINKIMADSRSVDENYTLAITEGDNLFGMKDYSGAKAAFTRAEAVKPAETYPRQRIIEINKIIEKTALAHSTEYIKALEVADKLYNTKVFDQAIDAYEAASKINPGDAYPELQIGKIRKYMSDHAILDLCSQSVIISKGNEKKFNFSAIDPSLRKNNYILLKARSTGKTAPKVYLNYGKDSQKNGGIVFRNLDKSTISDYLISISIQDKWFREENNWISISVETGDIEITKIQISAGE